MAITITETELSVYNLRRRMSFHFGNVHVTKGPQILLTLDAEVDGKTETGQSMGALAPMWFYKDPDMGLEAGIEAMVDVFEAACDLAKSLDDRPSPFALWSDLYDAVGTWATDTPHPNLLWNYGVSLVEQAVIDAYCCATQTPFPVAVRKNDLGIDLGTVHPELADASPGDLLPDAPVSEVAIRHTVGLSDPLTSEEVPDGDRLDDGLPQTLAEYVDQQGINHFKIKLAANDTDAERLRNIHAVVADSDIDEYALSLDANEQYSDVADFREQWETLRKDPDIAALLDNLLYVEQPLPRDEAFSEATADTFAAWSDRPPVIIDESDDRLDSLRQALDCGYAGTSHKNCKGVFKGLMNRCLIEHRRQAVGDRAYLMTGEDLTTLGPVELPEDFVVAATIGMDNVERNGHHYYRGLSMFSDDVQEETLTAHPDLFTRHEDGFVTLDVRNGTVSLDSVLEAPFGHHVDLNPVDATPIDEWSIESISE
ncbi:enolase C-terminal domain-like protein [Haladaptatus sp. DFWS20]|uniref:enolase C-terminal domain-like protein n=1 Tax=Haladaptatus sp. DFWS20 TaxID=3403467 RepID=UPI003EC0620B